MISLICGNLKTKQRKKAKQKLTHRYRGQTGSCQKQKGEMKVGQDGWG